LYFGGIVRDPIEQSKSRARAKPPYCNRKDSRTIGGAKALHFQLTAVPFAELHFGAIAVETDGIDGVLGHRPRGNAVLVRSAGAMMMEAW
jgi:hypothetical protein